MAKSKAPKKAAKKTAPKKTATPPKRNAPPKKRTPPKKEPEAKKPKEEPEVKQPKGLTVGELKAAVSCVSLAMKSTELTVAGLAIVPGYLTASNRVLSIYAQLTTPVAVKEPVVVENVPFTNYVASLKEKEDCPVEMKVRKGVVTLSPKDQRSQAQFSRVQSSLVFSFGSLGLAKWKKIVGLQMWMDRLRRCSLTAGKTSTFGGTSGVHVTESGKAFSTDQSRITIMELGQGFGKPTTLPLDVVSFLVKNFGSELEYQLLPPDKDSLDDAGRIAFCFDGGKIVLIAGLLPPTFIDVETIVKRNMTVEEGDIKQEIELSEEAREILVKHSRLQKGAFDSRPYAKIDCVGSEMQVVSRTPSSSFEDTCDLKEDVGTRVTFKINPELLTGMDYDRMLVFKKDFDDHTSCCIVFTDDKTFTILVAGMVIPKVEE